MGPPALFPIRRKVCCGFLSSFKIHCLGLVRTATFGSSGKHTDHYTTKATSFHHGYPCSYITWGMNNRPVGLHLSHKGPNYNLTLSKVQWRRNPEDHSRHKEVLETTNTPTFHILLKKKFTRSQR
jgi:hypothetical protein